MPIYTVRDEETNKTIKFEWYGELSPTEKELEEIFSSIISEIPRTFQFKEQREWPEIEREKIEPQKTFQFRAQKEWPEVEKTKEIFGWQGEGPSIMGEDIFGWQGEAPHIMSEDIFGWPKKSKSIPLKPKYKKLTKEEKWDITDEIVNYVNEGKTQKFIIDYLKKKNINPDEFMHYIKKEKKK